MDSDDVLLNFMSQEVDFLSEGFQLTIVLGPKDLLVV